MREKIPNVITLTYYGTNVAVMYFTEFNVLWDLNCKLPSYGMTHFKIFFYTTCQAF